MFTWQKPREENSCSLVVQAEVPGLTHCGDTTPWEPLALPRGQATVALARLGELTRTTLPEEQVAENGLGFGSLVEG